ncbi:hypothetical protein, partial [Clostridium perfringens]
RGLVEEFIRGHPRDLTADMVRAWMPDATTTHSTYGVRVEADPEQYFTQAKEFVEESRQRGLVAEFVRGHPLDMTADMVRAWMPDATTTHST